MCGIRVLFQLTYKISGGVIPAVRAPHLQFLGLFRTNRKSHLSWTAEACVTCAELSAGAFSYLARKSHPVSMRIQKQRHGLTNETKCLSSFKTWGNITLGYNWWFRLMCLHLTPRSPSLTRIISHQPANPTTNQQVDNCYDKNNKPVPPDAEMAFSSTSHFQKSSLIFLLLSISSSLFFLFLTGKQELTKKNTKPSHHKRKSWPHRWGKNSPSPP